LPQGEPITIEQKRMGGSAGPFAGRNTPVIKDAWLAFFTAIGRLHAWAASTAKPAERHQLGRSI
jgi:hypothetical protein